MTAYAYASGSQPVGITGNPDSFLFNELDGYWLYGYNAYYDLDILDMADPINAGLTLAELQDWPHHGVLDFSLPDYVGVHVTTGDTGSNVGHTTVKKDQCP